MANISDYEDNDNIINIYENDIEHGSFGKVEEAISDNEKDDTTEATGRVDPSTSKTRTVRSNVPRLNTERLKGPNGIGAIEKYYDDFKFYGKGHEKTDLDRIMKRLEHWSYRLFPKYHFDDFLAKAEQLGTKKDLQVYIKKYRLDMISSDDDVIIHDNMDNEDQEKDTPIDDFDLLITEQIQKQKQAEIRTVTSAAIPSVSNDDAFDQLLMQSDNTSSSQTQNVNTNKNQLSDEIKAKIERNKQLAIQRRLERQRKYEEETITKRSVENMNTEVLNENNNPMFYDDTVASQIDITQSQVNESGNEVVFIDEPKEMLLNEESQAMQT